MSKVALIYSNNRKEGTIQAVGLKLEVKSVKDIEIVTNSEETNVLIEKMYEKLLLKARFFYAIQYI